MWYHPLGLVDSASVGVGTRVWAWAHICAGAHVGEACNICEHCFIEEGAIVGDRVTIKTGVSLWKGLIVQDDVFIGPNVTFANDLYPRSKVYKAPLTTVLCKGCSIGGNATILPGLVLGERCMVGAGAVVTKDVPPGATVCGNPARIVK